MAVYLINPSDNSFGTPVITPRWRLWRGRQSLADSHGDSFEDVYAASGDGVG